MSDNKVTVKVLHNTNLTSMIFGYEPGDVLTEQLSFQSGFPACGHVVMLLRIVFRQLNNEDDCMADWAKEYFAGGNRSLSVGDVIVVGEQAFSIEGTGFAPIILEFGQIQN
jgi:hypothetical protein